MDEDNFITPLRGGVGRVWKEACEEPEGTDTSVDNGAFFCEGNRKWEKKKKEKRKSAEMN